MAQYESLKDYLSLNRKDEILKKANEYFQAHSDVKNNACLKDITIITVSCVEGIYPTAMVFMDVSAEVYNNNNTSVSSAYYSISFSGNVLTGFLDLELIIAGEISENELYEENIPAMFCLPDISIDTIEEEAQRLNRILCTLIKKDPEHKYWFDPVKVKEKHKLKMWPAELDDGILGQIRFTPSRADIYDIRDMSKCFTDEPIPANAILINSEYYKGHSMSYDDIIVATHELVHWSLHKMYFNIMQLLEGDFNHMSCSSEPIVFEDSMSLKDKAYWYAEWQANELAIRVAMPKHLVEKAIEEYNNDESVHNPTDKPFSGMYYHHMIEKLSWDFNVPEVIVKERLRQLGYDYADGTFVTVDDCSYQPFTFPQGTLKENETFVIDRDNYERLLRENKDFAELIENRYYLYTGYVICINDVKYISPVSYEKGLRFELSHYAREHADECCLKFIRHPKQYAVTYTDFDYLCKLDDGEYLDENGLTQEVIKDYESYKRMKEDEKEARQILAEMDKAKVVTFKDALRFHMERLKIDVKDMCDEEYLKTDTFLSYYKGKRFPSIERALIICNKLNLPYSLSIELLKKAHISLNTEDSVHAFYDYLLTITNATLEEWNLLLIENNYDPLCDQVN